jgi:diguanylate cyclase (GGDEF)-like protein
MITQLLQRYAHIEKYAKRKMAVLGVSITTFFICIVLYFSLQETLVDHSTERQVVSLVLSSVLIISIVFLYHRYQQHAVNTFIVFLVGLSIVFLRYEQLVALYVLLVVTYLIIRIVYVKLYQILFFTLFVTGIYAYTIIDSWAINSSRLLGIQLLFSALVSIVVIGFIYTFVGYIESEIQKSDRIQNEFRLKMSLQSFNRRKMDDIDATQKLTKNIAVLMIGINNMVDIGDAFIEEDVQKILKGVVGIIRNTIRVDDYIIRWAPSVFLVILHYISESNSLIVAEKIKRAVSEQSKIKFQYEVHTNTIIVASEDDSQIQESIQEAYESLQKKQHTSKTDIEIIKK